MKLLFICNQNENRSKTAEFLFKDRYETKSAGLYNEHPLKEKDLEWADLVLVMEDDQRREISKRFPKTYLKKKILSLEIPDVYYYNQESLKTILDEKLTQAIH